MLQTIAAFSHTQKGDSAVLYFLESVGIYNILGKKCPYSKLFWSVLSRIRTEYGDLLHKSPYSVRMWKNMDQKNSEYGHFSRSNILEVIIWISGAFRTLPNIYDEDFLIEIING